MRLERNQKITLTIAIALLLLFYLFTKLVNKNIDENGKQTIDYVYGYFDGPSVGPELSYEYYVGKEKYKGGYSIQNRTEYEQYKNRFYKVIYSVDNPGFGKILLNQPVIDTTVIKSAGFSLPKTKTNQFQAN